MDSQSSQNDGKSASSLASLFYKVPKIADIIAYELGPGEVDVLMQDVEPALSAFCKGPGGGLERLVKIAEQGRRYRRDLKRLPDPPRLLAEQWRDILMDKVLVSEEAESGPEVCNLPYCLMA